MKRLIDISKINGTDHNTHLYQHGDMFWIQGYYKSNLNPNDKGKLFFVPNNSAHPLVIQEVHDKQDRFVLMEFGCSTEISIIYNDTFSQKYMRILS